MANSVTGTAPYCSSPGAVPGFWWNISPKVTPAFKPPVRG